MKKHKSLAAIAVAIVGGILAGCADDAQVASRNISKAADNFEINRRIVFFNGITDKYLLEVVGRCSIEDQRRQLEVVCKTGDNEFKKHFLGLSDNVSYLAEQLGAADASAYHYRITFKPQTIIPDVDLRADTNDAPRDQN